MSARDALTEALTWHESNCTPCRVDGLYPSHAADAALGWFVGRLRDEHHADVARILDAPEVRE